MDKKPEDIHQWYTDLLEVFKDINAEQGRLSDRITGASAVIILILLIMLWR